MFRRGATGWSRSRGPAADRLIVATAKLLAAPLALTGAGLAATLALSTQ